jgi:hypothetical protein
VDKHQLTGDNVEKTVDTFWKLLGNQLALRMKTTAVIKSNPVKEPLPQSK